jgi:hypothetical protein
MDAIALYTCARPGRSLGPKREVADKVVKKWIEGLPGTGEISLISLLGQKPDGISEYSFYSFGNASGFLKFLQQHSSRPVYLFEFPTIDFNLILKATCEQIRDRLNAELKLNRTVIIVDSGGVQRTSQVCRQIGIVEDPRNIR